MRTLVLRWTRFALFAIGLFAIALTCERTPGAVSMALIWVPTGLAITAVVVLGPWALLAIAAATVVNRIQLGYSASVWIPAMLGSTVEAGVGAWLLARLSVNGRFARLRDVVALLSVAMLAPLASITCSVVGRMLPGEFRVIPFDSGWDGWWRMNALGVLTVVPLALVWRSSSRPTRSELVPHAINGLAAIGVATVVMLALQPGVPSILLLMLTLPMALFAAVHLGPRGAITTGSLGALTIMWFAARGTGAFQGLAYTERHIAAQLCLMGLVAVPLVFGALIAERQGEVARSASRDGLHRALIRVLPDAIYRVRADDTIADLLIPDSFPAVVQPQQIVGRRIGDLFVPDVAARLLEQIGNARAGRSVTPIEYSLSNQVGDREVRYVPLADGEVLGVVRDVTARRQMERQLGWQATVLEAIAAGANLDDVLRRIVDGVEGFLQNAQASLLLIRGRRLHVAYAPRLPAAYNAIVDGIEVRDGNGCCGTAAATGKASIAADIGKHPLWAPYRDLAQRFGLAACWSIPIKATDGAVVGTFALYHGKPRNPGGSEIALVERAATLAGLAIDRSRREELLASIQENVSEGLFRCAPEHGLRYANQACASMFGYPTAAQLIAATQAARTRPEGTRDAHARSLVWLADALVAGHLQECELHRADGTTFHALWSTTLVRDADGEVTACDGAVADITANKQLAEQLRQSQKMEAIGHLAGGIAHDFNNLLTAIGGFAETLRFGLEQDDPRRHDADEILRATRRAAELTRQLLAFGRRQVLSPRAIDVPAAVDQMLDMLGRLIGERIHLRTEHVGQGLCARVDHGQFEQVVLNLVLNARDAMPDGGTVTIRTGRAMQEVATGELPSGRYATIAVHDEGIGMSDAVRARAFDPFFTTKPVGQGSGLGLSMVYGIVKQSGGAIRIDSSPGHGTTVTVHLPLTDERPEAEPVVLLPRTGHRTGKVLVVEDEPLVRDLVERALTRAGHTVLTADDGEAALRMVQEHRDLDAVITDVVMPKLGGRELVAALRAKLPQLPVLFVSGYHGDGESLLRTVHGHAAVLAKPFTTGQLQAALQSLLPGAEPTLVR